ncbi:hypothetical protein [Actinoplanes friuliensis]|uniref:Uncharacterized protein n=1 Tax=Actinoplanes friuliensis DSM 7358 TaxID=1246995 RepID=U5W9V9_9ACTN|nr:hypothetical protein [Actinoplanes friuliensis]AGZ44765.1 hypothetical protein AFR_32535 [Actinoplanes friuliensis DSM 7358]
MVPLLPRAAVTLVLGLTPVALGEEAPPPEGAFAVDPSRLYGVPGDQISVGFKDKDLEDRWTIRGCEVWFEQPSGPVSRCPAGPLWEATVTVPEPDPSGRTAALHWRLLLIEAEEEKPPIINLVPEPGELPGSRDFTILRFDVEPDRPEAEPGGTVGLTFVAVTPGLEIIDCGISAPGRDAACDGVSRPKQFGQVPIPRDLKDGQVTLGWKLTYTFREQVLGEADGTIKLPVRAPPPPPPEFSVVPSSTTASPGQPLSVTFLSLTPGVTVETCAVALDGRAPCSASGVAVVIIPPGTQPGAELRLPWDLVYSSTRPGEQGRTADGVVEVDITVIERRFAVTVQPRAAVPGGEVTLAFESLVEGVDIVDCIGFFPRDPGGRCQRSPERWLARTSVPADAEPGASLLRWGVASLTADGTPGADSGVVAYRVLAPPTPSRTTGTPRTDPPDTPSTPDVPAAPDTTARVPVLVVVTDPESAGPGEDVTVTVSALDPGVTVTGCTAGFAGQAGSACGKSGGRRSSTVVVPEDARPGRQSLRWSATARTDAGTAVTDAGTVTYRILAGDAVDVPAFSVRPEPPAAEPGGRVAVAHRPLTQDVTITGCSAGFTETTMAACHETERGWVADVAVPDAAPPGAGTVLWKVAYTRTGGEGSTDGLLSLDVLAAPKQEAAGFWTTARGIGWRVALGAALLVVFAGARLGGRRLIDRRRRPAAGGEPELPDGVRVVPVLPATWPAATISEPDAAPRRLIRLTLRDRRPDIRISGE